MSRGKFFVLSGGEGCGKSTILKLLSNDHPQLIATREPGGTETGRQIRNILLHQHELNLRPLTEVLLFFADRYQHVCEKIQPAIDAGQNIGTDRYWMDTYAYQVYTELGVEDLKQFMTLVRWLKLPDPGIWLLLDIDPVIGLARKHQMNELNRMDQQPLEFHQRVRQGFLFLAERVHFPVKIIDASQSIDQVYREVVDTLQL